MERRRVDMALDAAAYNWAIGVTSRHVRAMKLRSGLVKTDQGGRRQYINRRHALKGAALGGAGLAAAALVGCGRSGTPTAAPGAVEQNQPKRGGILIHRNGYETQGTGFDPHVISIFFSEGYTLFYQRLLSYTANAYEIEAELAQKWEQPSPTEFVFTLQPNVKWHNKPPVNGRALTA